MQATMQSYQQVLAPLPSIGEIDTEAASLLAAARNMAFSEAAQGRLGHGLSLLQQALEQEPMAHDLLSDMAALLLSAGELNHAATYAQQALAIDSCHGASLYALGFALSGLGESVRASAVLRQLMQGEALASLMHEAPDLLPVAQTELARLDALLDE